MSTAVLDKTSELSPQHGPEDPSGPEAVVPEEEGRPIAWASVPGYGTE